MYDLILKLIKDEQITNEDLANALYEICDDVHGCCDSDCPVYYINNNSVPIDDDQHCSCFKNGTKMLVFLRNHINK